MATIKEVAKLAGVSLGTASNVLNGKTQNEELIRRVEKAMEELAYQPDANARSLKNTQSSLIGVILPDALQRDYAEFLHNLERCFREQGYSIVVKFSRNNRLIEKKCIESCLQQSVAGIVLYSNVRDRIDARLNGKNVPGVIIGRNKVKDSSDDRIVIDYGNAFESALEDFRGMGLSRVGLILEKELMQNEEMIKKYRGCFGQEELFKVVESNQEQGFQAFFELYTAAPDIQAVIVGSEQIGIGVHKAAETLEAQEVRIVVMKESRWMEDSGKYHAQLTVLQKEVAEASAKRMIDAIARPNLHENITSVIPAGYDKDPASGMQIQKASGELVFAMYDCSSSRSLKMLSRIYEKESGKKIRFDLLKYRELEELLYESAMKKDKRYDGFMMDITWLEGLVESGGVANLDGLLKKNQEYFTGFVDGVVKECGMYVESLYAVPFMSGAQILFYQKDLFEDRMLQMRFRRMYGEELTPPKTWAQFNLVAEFFTKSINPQSPVKYGTSLPTGANVYTTISFLSHLWAYGSDVFDEKGNVVIDNGNSAAALKNLIASYQYTSGNGLFSWNDVADEFAAGDSAMIVLYDSDAGNINNYTKSKVAGNLGCALVPGGKPVLGGWSLGLNRYGRHMQDAQNFLIWACGNQNAIPLTLLGGSTLRKDYYERSDLEYAVPWKTLILESYRQSKKRYMPEILDESRRKNNIYTEIIPGEIERVLRREIDESQAIRSMKDRIEKLVKK